MRKPVLAAVFAAASIVLSTFVPVAAHAVEAPPAAGTSVSASTLLSHLEVATPATVAYDRDRFAEGLDLDGNGCRTRNDLLIAEGTDVVASGCTVASGTWYSYYDNTYVIDPSALQMDHLVALAEAWRSGAWAWSDETRAQFANDVDIPESLVLVTASANQAKSDKDPAGWLPSYEPAQCRYVAEWVTVKFRWHLSVDVAERDAIADILAGCGEVAVVTPERASGTSDGDPGHGGAQRPEAAAVSAALKPGVSRLEGADRFATAVAASRLFEPGAPVAYIATGMDFPDALSAAAAAAHVGGPLLLTRPTVLPDVVATELHRLKPQRIVVVGGTGAVSVAIERQARTYAPRVERVGGASRYDTSLAIAKHAFTERGAGSAFIATGTNFPDALGATGVAGLLRAPVVLIDGLRGAPAATVTGLQDLGVSHVYIAGSTGVVSSGVETALRTRFSVERRGGADRFATAVALNKGFFDGGSQAVFVATGMNFPDALSGSAVAGLIGAPMYLTRQECMPEPVRDAINAQGSSKRTVMGSPGAVSTNAATNLACLTAAAPKVSGTVAIGRPLTATTGSWTSGTSFSYQWLAAGAAISGATGATFTPTSAHAGKAISVRVTGSKMGYVGVTVTSAATARVPSPAPAPAPAPVNPPSSAPSGYNCPASAPIKGNRNSMIYHVPGGAYYSQTKPEQCFSTEAAARAAGYRRSKR